MKFLIVLGDGMADRPIAELGGKTVLQYANKSNMDNLAKKSEIGMVQTIPEGMEPGSGPANMSVMGYSPEKYYTGRSPLEAVSLGIDMTDTDVAYRVNLVSLEMPTGACAGARSMDGEVPFVYENTILKDYSSGEITTEESRQLIEALKPVINSANRKLYSGRSYRHCLIWDKGPLDVEFTPPHDITGRPVREYMPKGEGSLEIIELMKKSWEILKDHPVNVKRRQEGKNTADSIWLWGQGTKPATPNFTQNYHMRGAMISAVDLLYGLARCSGLDLIEVEGATGTKETNFTGKANAAIKAFEDGIDYVYVHLEAPDECGHQGDRDGKVYSVETIDKKVLGPIWDYLEKNREQTGEDYHIMVLPDHPTPLEIRTHAPDSVPYMLYRSECKVCGSDSYDEVVAAANKELAIDTAPELFERFIKS